MEYVISQWTAKRSMVMNGISVKEGAIVNVTVRAKNSPDDVNSLADLTETDVVILPVNRNASAEEQAALAQVICNYLNKLEDAKARAAAGVAMGFLQN